MPDSSKGPLTGKAAQLLAKTERVLAARHYSRKTRKAYLHWIGRFLRAYIGADPYALKEADVNRFLSHMAVELNVSSSTQNQALAAIKFFFKYAIGEPLESLDLIKARGSKRKITALTAEEVSKLLAQMQGVPLMVCMLLYGSGLRLEEGLTLRVKDIDFRSREVIVRDGKGRKDRITVLPGSVIEPLQAHLKQVRRQHLTDLEDGLGKVPMPYAFDRKYPNADREWIWQWAFPARSHYLDRRTGTKHRHHLHESVIQKAVRAAAKQTNVTKHVTPHVLRHSFATHLISNRCDLRTLQELMGHEDIRTTQRYLHVTTGGSHGIVSPLDGLTLNEGATDPRNMMDEEVAES